MTNFSVTVLSDQELFESDPSWSSDFSTTSGFSESEEEVGDPVEIQLTEDAKLPLTQPLPCPVLKDVVYSNEHFELPFAEMLRELLNDNRDEFSNPFVSIRTCNPICPRLKIGSFPPLLPLEDWFQDIPVQPKSSSKENTQENVIARIDFVAAEKIKELAGEPVAHLTRAQVRKISQR